jgi:hypothetical protein
MRSQAAELTADVATVKAASGIDATAPDMARRRRNPVMPGLLWIAGRDYGRASAYVLNAPRKRQFGRRREMGHDRCKPGR